MKNKAMHAIDFVVYASDWYPVYSDSYGLIFRNAPVGFEPTDCKLEIVTPEQLYDKFLKYLKTK
jgi:hypothetical protein